MAFIEKQKAIHPDHIDFLTTFAIKRWDEPDWQEKTIDHLNRAFKNGAIGVKLWKNIGIEFRDEYGDFILIDHPRFDPVLDFIESQNKTLTGHIVEPLDCWLALEKMKSVINREYYTKNPQYYMYIHPEFPSHDELVRSYERMLEKHPRIRYVGCHLAGFEHSLNELAKRLDRFPNMAVDLAARIDAIQLLNRNEVRSFFIKYQDRILYGTDLSINETYNPQKYAEYAHQIWKADWVYFATDSTLVKPGIDKPVHGLNLPKLILKKIYWKNAKKWYPGI
jgi:hypothetical protein